MTPAAVALVQDSFRQVVPIAGVAADLFYDRLFDLDPALRPMFPSEMSDQKRKLVQMLAAAVNGLSDPDALVPAVQGLGRRHAGYGVAPAHYATVGTALIDTLAEGLGEDFTPEVRAAWTQTYALLSGVMIAAAEPAEA